MTLSIRVKIMALALAVLLVSFGAYLFAGRSLIVKDKSSYIYDYNLSLVRELKTKLSSRIDQLRTISQTVSLLLSTNAENEKWVASFYEQNKTDLPHDGFLVIRPQNKDTFLTPESFPRDSKILIDAFQAQKWLPSDFDRTPILVGQAMQGKLPIGFRALAGTENPIVVFALLEIDQAQLLQYGDNVRIEVLDPKGNLVQFGSSYSTPVTESELAQFRSSLLLKPFESGAQDVTLGNTEYLASYSKVQGLPIVALGLISKAQAFATAQILMRQSILLGLGILFFAVAGVLIFSKGITERLKDLWLATQRVGGGDFHTHITLRPGKLNTKDEITDLVYSFNKMADRINELMKETAEKARMTSELETAQTVQNKFFPSSDFKNESFEVSGNALPATECGGDWWQYRQIGEYLLVAIGDVTGHGVSSALVTAAAYGAFSITISRLEREYEKNAWAPDIGEVLQQLNVAVRAAGGDVASMTMLISLINTQTGEMQTCNASHRLPYIYSPGSASSNASKSAFRVVSGGLIPQLGLQKDLEIHTVSSQLEPGDFIIWYTDGLLECENPEGQPLRRLELQRKIANLHESHMLEAHSLCFELVKFFKEFLGKKAENPDDDTTIVIAKVSENAKFQNPSEKKGGLA